jgi:tannase
MQYTYDIPSTGGVFITKFLEQVNLDNLANIDGVTYDTIVSWMKEGMDKYLTTLQTTNPDISTFHNSGGESPLLSFHSFPSHL